ncbi:MAG: hypothetical protein Q9200_004595 [Gallowayella weberi]
MTYQLLSAELSNLIQESKRKSPDLRNAAEQSFNDLKALPNTSEAQLAAGLDVQLKVLQAVPSLLQNYADNLQGKLMLSTFRVCFALHSSKIAVVANTAAASLQQLLSFVFEKVAAEDDETGHPSNDSAFVTISIQERSVRVHSSASDAYHLLNDICLLTDGSRPPRLLERASLTPEFGLELLESLLIAHLDTVSRHEEDVYILQTRLIPLVIRILSEKNNFNVTVRAVRLLRLLVRRFLSNMTAEIEMVMSLINHLLDFSTSVIWKRVLCLELYRDLHDDPELIRSLYAHFDQEKGRRNIIGDHLAIFVRLASEKPAVIGLDQMSSASETQHNLSTEQIAIEAGGLSGAVGISADDVSPNQQGLNKKWSTVRTSCMDQVDKTEPPMFPATYIYSLVLTCINRFSDGLAKFLLPFAVQPDNKSKRRQKPPPEQRSQDDSTTDDTEDPSGDPANTPGNEGILPVNPLMLRSNEKSDQIRTSALIVEHCWPALLAASSTFLKAALDSEFYHALIRSVQRFTHVAGLLDLATPRDAFLTTLAKHAVPSASAVSLRTPVSDEFKDRKTDDRSDGDATRRGSKQASGTLPELQRHSDPSLTPRNLLCLRALLNLGTALGPVLRDSWSIVFETLHQVDIALILATHQPFLPSSVDRMDENETLQLDELNAEKNAVEVATSRLFESTSNLPNREFVQALECLCSLVYGLSKLPKDNESLSTAKGKLSPMAVTPTHHRFASTSGMQMNETATADGTMGLLNRTMQMVQWNIARLSRTDPSDSGWSIFIRLLIDHICSPTIVPEVRINAAKNLNDIVNHLISFASRTIPEQQNETMSRCLEALSTTISCLWTSKGTRGGLNCSLEIHFMTLGALLSALEQAGENLRCSWETVFSIINSVFVRTERSTPGDKERPFEMAPVVSRSPKLVRSSFAILQLICSDFLTSIPDRCILMLLNTQHCFCTQSEDLNISLTSVALFRNVSDFLQRDEENQGRPLIDADVAQCLVDTDLVDLINAQGDNVSRSPLWASLLLHLGHLYPDGRLEVRHSALRTLFGLFDACRDRLDAEAWMMCYQLIFLHLLSIAGMELKKDNDISCAEAGGWVESAVLLVRDLCKTFILSLGPLSGHRRILALWQQMLAQFASLFDSQSLVLSRTIFDSLTGILAEIKTTSCADNICLDAAWMLWRDHNPAPSSLQDRADNNDAVAAYLLYINQLYSMLSGGFDKAQAEAVMMNLRLCVIESTATAYGSDINETTTVQNLVLKIIALLPMAPAEVLQQKVEEVAALVILPFQVEDKSAQRGKTYIALSKAAMEALDSIMYQDSVRNHPSMASLLTMTFRALEVPIHLKYQWQRQGKGTQTWKKATSTFLSILNAEMVRECSGSGKAKQSMWEAIIKISDGILAADTNSCESTAAIGNDQMFDMESFSRLQNSIIPTLGSPSIPDQIRRNYMSSLFEHSIIHEPHPDDLARPEQELLDGLRSQHIGRVQDLPPIRRSKMAYMLLDELFDLAAVHDGSVKRVRLAQIAAPYLVLRVGLVLKAYACDQPLRGLMPQPQSQRREMNYVLKKLIDLNSEPKAIPATSGVESEHKKHLFLLFGLITRALKAARRDEGMRAALTQVLDVLGTDFGF